MGHEDTILSQFICIGLICIAAYQFRLALKSNKKIDLDQIEIFRITDISPAKKTLAKAKKTKKQKPKYTPLQEECMEALKALGVKTQKERIYLVHKIFQDHNPKSIQEFISKAFH